MSDRKGAVARWPQTTEERAGLVRAIDAARARLQAAGRPARPSAQLTFDDIHAPGGRGG